MRMAIVAMAFAFFAGCEESDDLLVYRKSIPSDMPASERLKIERELKAGGWDDVQFIMDFTCDVVVARKPKSAISAKEAAQ